MPCLCHGTDFDAAVEAHKHVVLRQIQKSSRSQPGMSDYDDLLSDGLLHLWLALRDFNPNNGYVLDAFLSQRIAQRLIDGIRSRTKYTYKMKQRGDVPVEEVSIPDNYTGDMEDPQSIAEARVVGDAWLTSLAEIHDKLPRIVELLGLKFTVYEVERKVRMRADLLAEVLRQVPGMEGYELPSRPKMRNVFCKQGHQLTMRTCQIRRDASRVCLTCRREKKRVIDLPPLPESIVEIRVFPRPKRKLRRRPSSAA